MQDQCHCTLLYQVYQLVSDDDTAAAAAITVVTAPVIIFEMYVKVITVSRFFVNDLFVKMQLIVYYASSK